MKLSKMFISTTAALTVAGAVGFAYAQSNAESINVKGPNNLTQTQSDAALPCQPTPFNPHLPTDKKTRASGNSGTVDCPTVTSTDTRIQNDASVMREPAPLNPNIQTMPQANSSSASVSGNATSSSTAFDTSGNSGFDSGTINSELAPRADRN
jgi:hypothetical protein